mmetsp:Transcript_27830/g.69482  ORF Transcript_27830/g.69482 Transcript_27830/m.69482 type:complete len:339 (+) Transcript_27830:437-1453(+)
MDVMVVVFMIIAIVVDVVWVVLALPRVEVEEGGRGGGAVPVVSLWEVLLLSIPVLIWMQLLTHLSAPQISRREGVLVRLVAIGASGRQHVAQQLLVVGLQRVGMHHPSSALTSGQPPQLFQLFRGHHLVKSGRLRDLYAKLAEEERLDAVDVTRKVHLGVQMRRRHDLGEIDDSDVLLVVDEDVELVEVPMDQAALREPHNELHQPLQHRMWMAELSYLGHRISLDKAHEDGVAVGVDWLRHWEAVVVKGLHVGELLDGRQSRQVHPAGRLTRLQVVTVPLDRTERYPAESVEFEADDGAVTSDTEVDVALLPDTYTPADTHNVTAMDERSQRQKVIP